MKANAILLASVMLLAILAGCSNPGVSAKDLRAIANDSATGWDSRAQLISVVGLEINVTLPPEARAAMERARASVDPQLASQAIITLLSDPVVGDGKAPAWIYSFLSPKGLYGVIVGADGKVEFAQQVLNSTFAADVYEEISSHHLDLDAAVAAWNLDASEASDALAAFNSTFAQRIGKPEQMATWVLDLEDRDWEMSIRGVNDHSVLSAAISYVNGTVLRVREFTSNSFYVGNYKVSSSSQTPPKPSTAPKPPTAPKPKPLQSEYGEVDGTVGLAASATDGGSFVIKNATHQMGRFYFSAAETAAGAGKVDVSVTSPNGKLYQATLSPITSTDWSGDFEPVPGQWNVVFKASGAAVMVNAAVEWCTDGLAGSSSNTACQQMGSSMPTPAADDAQAFAPFRLFGLRPFADAP